VILAAPAKADFNFGDKIQPDVRLEGFTDNEIRQLAGAASADADDRKKGIGDWWKDVWKPNRKIPPAVQNLKSEFGYQSNPFLTDLRAVAEAQGTKLDGLVQAKKNWNFYIMRCGVYILPNDGEKFEALKFAITYKNSDASTFSMMPGPLSKKIFELGGTADIGVTGKFDFGFPELKLDAVKVDAAAKAKLEANFVVSFHYELKSQVVDSFGVGNPFCKWFLYKGENLRNDVVFYPIIMTPASVTHIDCEFKAFFKVSNSEWKNAEFFLKPPKTISVSA
jgi:hypothetical protein